MTADQPITLTIMPAVRWDRAVAACGLTALAVLGIWTAAWVRAAHVLPAAALLAAVGGALLALPACLALRRTHCGPLLLGWDGQQWFLADPERGRESPVWTGELRLMLRLGSVWLLQAHGAGRCRWLPVDAARLGPQGHPLLSALYCARPAAGGGARR